MSKELILIKNKYGEEMMHFCRENFSTILEQEGLLFELLSNHFDYSKNLLCDIKKQNKQAQFINYIYSLSSYEYENSESVNKTPEELLSDAGYILYECKSEEDIQRFKKYYANRERLCTFNGGRLNSCYVFFAVKKDAESIKRENFTEPKRQDLYGTSVISIQFSRGETNTLSIKNRYNHTVSNPDATFSNNLENIIQGLTKAFEKKYNLNIRSNKKNFELENYVVARDGKYYKYNYEFNNIFYCPNNIIIDNYNVKKFDKDRYIVFDSFILDMQEKSIKLYDNYEKDSFIDCLDNIKRIEIHKNNNGKKIIINKDIEIVVNNDNNIILYKNNDVKKINDNFLIFNKTLITLKLDNVESIGNFFMGVNRELKYLYLPNLKSVGGHFIYKNEALEKIDLPQLRSVGNYFLYENKKLREINLSQLESVGGHFLYKNRVLEKIDLPQLKSVGDFFLYDNQKLIEVNLAQLKSVRDYFLYKNKVLQQIDLPHLKTVGDYFLYENKNLKQINLPHLERVGFGFLYKNEALEKIDLQQLTNVGDYFLYENKKLREVYLSLIDKENYTDLNNFVYCALIKINNLNLIKSKVKKLIRK